MPSTDEIDFECAGKATDGHRYTSISEFWEAELAPSTSNRSETQLKGELEQTQAGDETNGEDIKWYSKSEAYWSTQTASVEGMLGGLGELHSRDVLASRRFIRQLHEEQNIQIGCGTRVVDVGAGIGRVTKHLLLPLFETVDMLEQSVSYLEESKSYIVGPPQPPLSSDSLTSLFQGGEVGMRFAVGMQDFVASGFTSKNGLVTGCLNQTLDVVWIQWTIGYLTDEDLLMFLGECVKSLKPTGKSLIVVKDNVARSGFLVDKEDHSIMRSHRYMLHLFEKARVQVVKHARQMDFPKSVHPVRMYALRPIQ